MIAKQIIVQWCDHFQTPVYLYSEKVSNRAQYSKYMTHDITTRSQDLTYTVILTLHSPSVQVSA